MSGEEIIGNLGSVLLIALIMGVAIYPMVQHPRAGWLAIPLGTAVGIFSLFQTIGLSFSGSDLVPVGLGMAISAFGGWRLPWPDSAFSVLGAPAISVLLGFFFGGGADNPLPLLILGCAIAFLAGGVASAASTLLRDRKVRRVSASG
jgi:hypothetical protein